jgi:hypothetical protein
MALPRISLSDDHQQLRYVRGSPIGRRQRNVELLHTLMET